MLRGKVKWFNNVKGYGFIIEDGCSDDLFVYFLLVQMDGYKILKVGQVVIFDKKFSDKGVYVINIVFDVQFQKVLQEDFGIVVGVKFDGQDFSWSDYLFWVVNV